MRSERRPWDAWLLEHLELTVVLFTVVFAVFTALALWAVIVFPRPFTFVAGIVGVWCLWWARRGVMEMAAEERLGPDATKPPAEAGGASGRSGVRRLRR